MNRVLGFTPSLADIRRHTLNDPDFNPDLFLGAFVNGELDGCIMGAHRPWKDTQKDTGFIKFILVRQQYRRRGIGRMLMEACESKLRRLGLEKLIYGSCSPLYLFPGVPKESSETSHLLESCSWQKESERISFFSKVNEAEVSKASFNELMKANASITIDLALPKDEKEVLGFIEREFSNSWAVESSPAFNEETNAFCSVLRYIDTSEVLGFAVVNCTNPNWFGPMGVHSEYRKRGMGQLLVFHSILTARDKGIRQLIFQWINGKEEFYSKFLPKATWQVFYKFVKQF